MKQGNENKEVATRKYTNHESEVEPYEYSDINYSDIYKQGIFSLSKTKELLDFCKKKENVISLALVKDYVSEGANPNQATSGVYLLHKACDMENVDLELIKYLVENKANLNHKIYLNGETNHLGPFHIIMRKEQPNLELIKFLVEQKGDICMPGNVAVSEDPNSGSDNISAATMIVRKGNQELKEYLLSALAFFSGDILQLIKEKQIELASFLLENTRIQNIDEKTSNGDTLLLLVCKQDLRIKLEGELVKIVKLIIKQNADVNTVSEVGLTPLCVTFPNYAYSTAETEYKHYYEEQLKLIRLLIEEGANCNKEQTFITTWSRVKDVQTLPQALEALEKTEKYDKEQMEGLKEFVKVQLCNNFNYPSVNEENQESLLGEELPSSEGYFNMCITF